jgi:hypothetical protein
VHSPCFLQSPSTVDAYPFADALLKTSHFFDIYAAKKVEVVFFLAGCFFKRATKVNYHTGLPQIAILICFSQLM